MLYGDCIQGQYDETSAVPVSYGGPEYSNYPEYHNPPPSYPGYDVGSTSAAYFITQPPPPLQNTAAPVPQYMPPQVVLFMLFPLTVDAKSLLFKITCMCLKL